MMNDLIKMLNHQEKMHSKSGANGLALLFKNAADRIAELEKERDNLTDDLIETQNKAREAENKFEDIESVFCDEDGYPLIESFNGEELADWITQYGIEMKKQGINEAIEKVFGHPQSLTCEASEWRREFIDFAKQLREGERHG